MQLNSKKNPLVVSEEMLAKLQQVKVKNHGFVTFASRYTPKVRYWGRVGTPQEKVLKKVETVNLPPLPDGVVLLSRKSGAVVRYVLTGQAARLALVESLAA